METFRSRRRLDRAKSVAAAMDVQAYGAYRAGMKRRQAEEAQEQHDLDFLFGSWAHDPAVEQALADQRKIDEDLWR